MSWFCQGITKEGRLCWLPKGHADSVCKSAPMADYPIPAPVPARSPGRAATMGPWVDGAVQLPLPGL